jgi:hypothetical protein
LKSAVIDVLGQVPDKFASSLWNILTRRCWPIAHR